MRGRRNTQKRLLWLRKQYRHEPEVFIRTASIIGFLNAFGAVGTSTPGDAYAHPQQMLDDLESFLEPYGGRDLTLEDYAGVIERNIRIDEYHEAGDRLAQRGAFDKYVAWVAKVINSLIKAHRAGTLKVRGRGRGMHRPGSGYWSPEGEWVTDTRFLALIQRIRLLAESLPQIRDWAEAERVNLMGLTYQQAKRGSNAWHRELEKQELAEGAEQGEVVFRFADGWTVQNLTKRAQIKQEGKALQHCVGSAPGYWRAVQQGRGRILSLRDADGRPQVTIQLDPYNFYPRDKPPPGAPDSVLQQAKASKNARPSNQVADRLVYWLLRTIPEGKNLQSAGLDHQDLSKQSAWMVPNRGYAVSPTARGQNPPRAKKVPLAQKWGLSLDRLGRARISGSPYALELAKTIEGHYPWAER